MCPREVQAGDQDPRQSEGVGSVARGGGEREREREREREIEREREREREN